MGTVNPKDLAEWDPDALDESARVAADAAEMVPLYRERARAWLDAEHADMVEDLALLLATVAVESCP